MDVVEKALDWALRYGDVLSVSPSTKFPNMAIKGAVGGIEHVISVDNGAYYMELWRDGSGSYYVTTGAKVVQMPGLAKGARLDDALDRFFRLMAKKARAGAQRRSERAERERARMARKSGRRVGPTGSASLSGARSIVKAVVKNIIGLSTPKRRKVSKGCPCDEVEKAVMEVRELALAGTSGGWEKLPRGWTKQSVRSFWETLTGGEEGKMLKELVAKYGFTECVERMRGKVDDPEAFCAAAHKEALGRWPAEDPD